MYRRLKVVGACFCAFMLVPLATVAEGSDANLQPSVSISPSSSLADQAIHIVVKGLQSNARVSVQLSSTDEKGDKWTSKATFQADKTGNLDPDQSASLSGSYQGIVPMGLIETMKPINKANDDIAYFWNVPKPQTFEVTVIAEGSVIAQGSFLRALTSKGVTFHPESIAATGFFGTFWLPPPGTPRHSAVLEFGGSEGGLDGQLLGGDLASAGYPTLDIAYFKEPGLPSTLSQIPLEYFAKALRWLAKQPQVDPKQIWASGGSRGSEAALLLGANYPSLVHGVFVGSPADDVNSSYPQLGSSAWTMNGKPLPFTMQFNNPTPTDSPAALIPVARIKGPVLMACGTADHVWASCAYSAAIMTTLNKAHNQWRHVLYEYTGAGHLVGIFIPYEPFQSLPNEYDPTAGSTSLSNTEATAQLWPRLLSFLAHPTASGTHVSNAIGAVSP